MANHRQVPQTKENNIILWRRGKMGGVVVKESPLERSKSLGGMTVFQWLIAGVVSLFVGVVTSFPVGACNSFPVEDSPVGV